MVAEERNCVSESPSEQYEYTCKSKCLDPEIPTKESPALDESSLPLPLEHIPATVRSLKECGEYQIRALLDKDPALLTAEDEDAMDDGFVICDLNVVRKKLQAWRLMFPRVKPFYALKCNPDPMVAAVLGQSGAAGFDCASVPEIQLALQSTTTAASGSTKTNNNASAHHGGNNKLCVYANPQRAEKDLDTALALSVRALTFDGPEELRKVHRAYQKQVEQLQQTQTESATAVIAKPDMILRLVVPDEHSSVPLGEKFGASPSSFTSLIELAVELGLRIVGVSFHSGSGNHDPNAFQVAIELAKEAMEVVDCVQQQAGITEKCWLLDIGGGYPGKDGMGGDCGRFVGSDASQESESSTDEPVVDDEATQESETTAKIANIVTPLLDELYPVDTSHVQIISEPGRYFVEGAFALCSRIYRVVVEPESARRHYYIAQGVQGVFKDCVLCGESFLPIPLALERPSDGEGAPPSAVVPTTVHGPSGEDYDIICRDYPLPVLQTGDWLIFDRMGAYTLSIAARNGRPPVRYLMGGSTL